MANEFKIKHGFQSSGDGNIDGTLDVSTQVNVNGNKVLVGNDLGTLEASASLAYKSSSLDGSTLNFNQGDGSTHSIDLSSLGGTALSSSYALSASHVPGVVRYDSDTFTSTPAIHNIVTLTQAEYDGIAVKDDNTQYLVTDGIVNADSASYASTASYAQGYVKFDTDTFTSTPAIHNIVTLTQAEYDGIATKDDNTQYLVTDGEVVADSASYATTASYVDPIFISSSAAAAGFGQGGVASIIAGSGISINQGTGDVTVTALATSGSNGQSVIAPFAFASIDSDASGTGIGVSYGAYQSGPGEIAVTFGTAQANTNYAVVTDNAAFDDIYAGISGKSTTGFTLQLYNSNGDPVSPSSYPITFLVYGEDPIATVGVAATGSLVSTGSLSSNTLTFTKGDGTTFDIDLSSIQSPSASYASTASYAQGYVKFDSDTFTSTPAIHNIVTLTQAEYDGIATKDDNTQYLVTDGEVVADSASYATTASYAQGYVKFDSDTFTSTPAIHNIVTLTQAEYDSIATKDDNTQYLVTDGEVVADSASYASTASYAEGYVKFNTDTFTSSPAIHNIVTLTQAEYDAIATKDDNTQYLVTDGVVVADSASYAEGYVRFSNDTFTSSPAIHNIVTLTQAEYDGIATKDDNTQYLVTDGVVIADSASYAEGYVRFDNDTFTSSPAIHNIVTLTQAEYDGIATKDDNTQYLVTDGVVVADTASYALTASYVIGGGGGGGDTLYSANGTITANRTVTGAGTNNLTFQTFNVIDLDASTINIDSGEVMLPGAIPAGSTQTLEVLMRDTSTGQVYRTGSDAFGGAPGGSNTHVQFNDNGSLGGESTFTYDKANNTLTVQSAGTGTNRNTPSIELRTSDTSIADNEVIGQIQAANSLDATKNPSIVFAADATWNAQGTFDSKVQFRVVEGTSEKLHTTMKASGRMGIGVADPTNGFLEVNGDVSGVSMYASADIVAYSDARSKTNVSTIDNALEKVNAVRGVTYNKVEDPEGYRYMGVIAQELQEALPEVVHEGEEGNLSVAYGNITGVLIEAIKELTAKVADLESKLGK